VASLGNRPDVTDFLNKAERFAGEHEEQVDKTLDRAGTEVDERTGHRYDAEVDKAVQAAEEHIGDDHQTT
jgi:hypothetical protein